MKVDWLWMIIINSLTRQLSQVDVFEKVRLEQMLNMWLLKNNIQTFLLVKSYIIIFENNSTAHRLVHLSNLQSFQVTGWSHVLLLLNFHIAGWSFKSQAGPRCTFYLISIVFSRTGEPACETRLQTRGGPLALGFIWSTSPMAGPLLTGRFSSARRLLSHMQILRIGCFLQLSAACTQQ